MRILGLLFFLQFPFDVTPQAFFGARALGMGSAVTAISGSGIHSGNPAIQKVHQLLISNGGPIGISGLAHHDVVNHWLIKSYGLEAGVQRFGDDVASRDKIYVGLSQRKDHTSIGVRLNLHQFRAIQSETEVDASCSIGVITQLTKNVALGAWLDQLSIKRKPETEDFLPLRMEAGLTCTLSETLMAGVTVLHQVDEKPILKAGIEHQLAQKVQVRLGVSAIPYLISAGIGFRYWKVSADFAGTYSIYQGIRISATAGVQLN